MDLTASSKVPNRAGVYAIVHRATGYRYIGSSAALAERFAEHRRMLSKPQHHSQRLLRAVKAHGVTAFEFRVLFYCEPGQCLEQEQVLLDLAPEYNMSLRACAPMAGRKHSEETCRRLAEIGRTRRASPETRARMSAAQKAVPITEHRTDVRRAAGRANKGRKHTDETKARMSASSKGHVVSAAQREAISKANKGRRRSAEMRERMRVAKRTHPEESRFRRPVERIDPKTGDIVRYASAAEAKRAGFPTASQALYGKQATSGGFVWRFMAPRPVRAK